MKNKLTLLLGVFFIFLVYTLLEYSKVIEYVDHKTYDQLQKVNHSIFKKDINSSVVIIDIDEDSLQALGQWPWSRLIISEIVSKLAAYHPSSVGLDILFPEEDKTSPNKIVEFYKKMLSKNIKIEGLSNNLNDNDSIFAKSIKNAKVVLPLYLSSNIQKNQICNIDIKNMNLIDDSSITLKGSNIVCNIPSLQRASSNTGFINASGDEDGIFRRVPLFIKYQDKVIPSFALANMMNLSELKIDKDKISILNKTFRMSENTNVLLDFEENNKVKKISVIDILKNNFDKKDITGKFVLIGSSAIGLHDNYQLANKIKINGIQVHSTLINNILNDNIIYYSRTYEYINLLLSFLLSIFIIYTFLKTIFKNLYIIFGFIVILFCINIIALSNNYYLSFGYFIIPLIVSFFLINLLFIIYYIKNKMKLEKEIIDAHSNTMESMIAMIQHVDTETGEHLNRTKEYVKLMSTYLYEHDIYTNTIDKDFIEFMYRASPLHDIGKIGIPPEILRKPEKLTKEEYKIIQTHSEIGKDIISIAMNNSKDSEFLKMAFNITYYHHEKWDGTGYPNKLKGEQIPLESRIMAIADVYDALINKRCYKKAFGFDYSDDLIISCKGTHFDPILVDAFIELKDEFKQIALENKKS